MQADVAGTSAAKSRLEPPYGAVVADPPKGTARTLLRGSSAQVSSRAVSLVCQFVHFAIAARFLAPSTFGSYVAATALLAIAAAVSEFGLGTTTVLELADHGDPVMVRRAQWLISALGVAAWLPAAALAAFVLHGTVLVAFLALTPGYALGRLEIPAAAWCQHRLQFFVLSAAEMLDKFLPVAALLLVVGVAPWHTWSADGRLAVIGATVGAGSVLSLSVVSFRAHLGKIPRGATRLWELLRRGLAVGALNTVSIINARLDQVILALVGYRAGLGAYGIASRLVDAGIAVMVAAGSVSLPLLAQRAGDDRVRLARAMAQAAALLAVAAGLMMFYLAPQLVMLLGGKQYREGVWLARLLAPAVVAIVLNAIPGQVVLVQHSAGKLIGRSTAVVAGNAVLLVILVNAIGIRGAAVATSVAEVAGLVVVTVLAGRLLPRSIDLQLSLGPVGGFLLASFGARFVAARAGGGAGVLVAVAGLAIVIRGPLRQLAEHRAAAVPAA
jgi:O-antigen/teichoic acid export membrane protein